MPQCDFSKVALATVYYVYQKYNNMNTTKVSVMESSPSDVFLGKGVLKIYSRFTGEHPC